MSNRKPIICPITNLPCPHPDKCLRMKLECDEKDPVEMRELQLQKMGIAT